MMRSGNDASKKEKYFDGIAGTYLKAALCFLFLCRSLMRASAPAIFQKCRRLSTLR